MCWGFIDKTGKIVIEPRFAFINSGGFKDGLAGVSVHTVYPQKYGIIKGYIDPKGNMVIPSKFEYVGDFCNGLAEVQIKNAEGQKKHGIIDKMGDYIIQPYYDNAYVVDYMYEGLTLVLLDDKKVYIDRNGKLILDPQGTPVKIEYRDQGDSLLPIAKENKYGYALNGSVVIEPKFDEVTGFMISKHYPCPYAKVRINNKYGFIDKTGRYLIEPEFDELEWFREGLASVKMDGKWGFIDMLGTVVIKPEFDRVQWFSDGLAIVTIEEKYGVINKNGGFVIYPHFDNLCSFSEGLAGVEFKEIMYDDNHQEWAYKNKYGNWIRNKNFRHVLQASLDG